MDYGEYLSESWDIEQNNPPVPHAEDLTLDELGKQLDQISIKDIKNILTEHNISFKNTKQTLEEIAIKNKLTPNKLYDLITKEIALNNSSGNKNRMQGSGMGRKTLLEFTAELDLDINDVIKRLERAGYFGEANETLKDIASSNNVSPNDIFNIINTAKQQ